MVNAIPPHPPHKCEPCKLVAQSAARKSAHNLTNTTRSSGVLSGYGYVRFTLKKGHFQKPQVSRPTLSDSCEWAGLEWTRAPCANSFPCKQVWKVSNCLWLKGEDLALRAPTCANIVASGILVVFKICARSTVNSCGHDKTSLNRDTLV